MSITPERLALSQELANVAIQINVLRDGMRNTTANSFQSEAYFNAYNDLLEWRETLIERINKR